MAKIPSIFELFGAAPRSSRQPPRIPSASEKLNYEADRSIAKTRTLIDSVQADRERRNRITSPNGKMEIALNEKARDLEISLDRQTDPSIRAQLRQELEQTYAMIDVLVTELHNGVPHPNKNKFPDADRNYIRMGPTTGSGRNS